jgi:phage tail-like protein
VRPAGPKFWLLDGRIGWRTAEAEGIDLSEEPGLRLADDAEGPLGLATPGGSLGALRLPRRLALDGGDVYLLDTDAPAVRRFDPARGEMVALPSIGGRGSGPRELDDPRAVAIADRWLYIADPGNRRVQVFALDTLALRAVWGPGDPVDMTAAGGLVYILDSAHGKVWRHDPAREAPELVVHSWSNAGRGSGLAVDRQGRIYLYEPDAGRLDVFDSFGVALGSVHDAGSVRDRFERPALVLDRGRFCLPPSLTRECDRRPPEVAPSPEDPLRACRGGAGLIFDLEGRRVKLEELEPRGPRLYERSGTWTSEALDSEIPGCQWHRIELDLARLPAGSSIEVRTFADERERSLADIPESMWETRRRLAGSMQPGDGEPGLDEFLVQSRPARYLWIRIELHGDGYSTPAVRALRAHYPRESSIANLPEVYAGDDEGRWFLERFLSIADSEWGDLGEAVEELPGDYDPDSVPEGDRLDFLAGWLGLPLEAAWDGEQRRRALRAAPELYPRRGTVDGVEGPLRVYLENMTGLDLGGLGWPRLVEGFRERWRLLLGAGPPAPLWSPDVVGRLQVGVYSRAGEARLVSTGDPQRDLFHEHAHRFGVFVPAAWVRSADDERMLRRAVEAEKPAHTKYELCLVEPRLRVGVQCTVGVDTVVGVVPVARLACPGEDVPESLPPRGRIGFDTVLAGVPEPTAPSLS